MKRIVPCINLLASLLVIASCVKHLASNRDADDAQRQKAEAIHLLAGKQLGNAQLTLVFWTDDKIVLQETWTRIRPAETPDD